MKKNIMLGLLTLMILTTACSKEHLSNSPTEVQNQFASAAAVIDSMKTGFNLGNTFEYSLQNTDPSTIFPIIDLYKNAGMKHIRIPVTWMDGFAGNTLADNEGNINFSHPRFLQLKTVIDYAIAKNMFVIINAHHEYWLYNQYDGSEVYNEAFSNLWKGIATHFKTYPHLLIFEVLNEPQGVFGDWSGGIHPLDANALALTRQINKIGYDAIRATGGLNQHRVVMASTNAMGNHFQLDDVYPNLESLPGNGLDQYLAFQVHTYDPWEFCG